jgi:hypothetical protein
VNDVRPSPLVGPAPAPGDVFTPPIGRLFVRIVSSLAGDGYGRFDVAYAITPRRGVAYRYLCVFDRYFADRYGKARLSAFTDTADASVCKTGSGNTVTRRLATDEDIAALVTLWDPEQDRAGWLESLAKGWQGDGVTLAVEDQERLRAALQVRT